MMQIIGTEVIQKAFDEADKWKRVKSFTDVECKDFMNRMVKAREEKYRKSEKIINNG